MVILGIHQYYIDQNFPNVTKMSKDKIQYLEIIPFNENDKITRDDGIKCQRRTQRVGGGMFAGNKEILLKYFDIYHDMFKKYRQVRRFT